MVRAVLFNTVSRFMKRITNKLLIILLCTVPCTIYAGADYLRNTADKGNNVQVRMPLVINAMESHGTERGMVWKDGSEGMPPAHAPVDDSDGSNSEKYSKVASGSCDRISVSNGMSGNYFLDASSAATRLVISLDNELFFVVWTSLKISLLAVFLASLAGIPLGMIVALTSFAGKDYLQSLLNTLMAMPTVVVGLLLYGLLNRQGLLGDYGLLYTPSAMVIGQSILIMPIIWNLSIAAVNSADPRLHHTCLSLGANILQRSFIYFSEVRFAMMAAVVAGFGRAIGEVGVAMMLGGNINGYTRTMTTAIALETSKGDFEFALALGFMLLMVAFIVNMLLQQFQRVK